MKRTFLDDLIYEIEVVDAGVDSEGRQKHDAEVYSKVKRIIGVSRREGGSIVVPINRS